MTIPSLRSPATAFCCACGLLGAGCGGGLQTDYGRSNGSSINGSGVLAEMFRGRGDDVRTAYRLTEQVGAWADVVVRFSPQPGPPDRDEGAWYLNWLSARSGRRLVYVVNDYDAEEEYWNRIIAQFDSAVDSEVRRRAESKRDDARGWVSRLPPKSERPANPDEWFRPGRPEPPRICKALSGPWSRDLDAEVAGVAVHEPFANQEENVLLAGDALPLAIDWPVRAESRVLAVANGSFLLNSALADPPRRRLAERVLDWTRPDAGMVAPLRVVFIDGGSVLADLSGPPSIWDLLVRVASFRWVAIQMGILGLAACLARAPRLGRPCAEPTGEIDRPSAHAEALGELLARTPDRERSAQALEHYRAWRRGRPGDS